MKETNFTFLLTTLRNSILVFLLSFGVLNVISAQCSLGCNSSIQVSLDDANCEATVTPEMVLNGQNTSCPGGSFVVELRFNGNLLPFSPTLTSEYVNKTVEAKVIDENTGNSCWGWIHVEDKLAPIIDCPDDMTIFCYDVANFHPDVIENCSTPTLNITNDITITNNCNNGFPQDVLKSITRTYTATDAAGNISAPCTFTFDVYRIPTLDMIDMPANRLFPLTNLQCDENYAKDSNGHPSPTVTGVPTLLTNPLYPNPDLNCNLLVDYQDVVLPAIACVTKIMRTWTVIEWSCSNPQRIRTYVQMIEIADSHGPSITGIKDLTVSTSSHQCEAHLLVPPAVVNDNCSSVSVTISGGDVLIVGNGGYTNLPVGLNQLIYRATDACGNATTAAINVLVEDLTPPVAICIQNTTVGLTSDGQAWVHASVFDNGSYDECQLAKMLVRRMNNACGDCKEPEFPGFKYLGTTGNHYYYLSSHKLSPRFAFKHAKAMGGYLASVETSAEAAWLYSKVHEQSDTLDYLIGLSDRLNEGNFAWESGAPTTYTNWMSGQPDGSGDYTYVEATNGKWYDTTDDNAEVRYVVEITDPCGWSAYTKFCCSDIGSDVMVSFRVIDAACNWNDCMVSVQVQDKLPPSITCPADLTVDCDLAFDYNHLDAFFGEATVHDNCSQTMVQTYVDNLTQCNTGTIVRTFTATDAGGRKATCNQTVTFTNPDPFYINHYDPFDPTDDVIWPSDVTMDGCDDPTSGDYAPSQTGRPIFTQDQCDLVGADYDDKIYTFNNPNGEACFKIIRTWTVIDWCQFTAGHYYEWTYQQIIKVHNTVKPVITSSCARKETCTYDPNCASGYIELTASATDDCTTLLHWSYKVDLNNDGSFEPSYNNSGTANTANASGNYPIGSHRIVWTFEDKCGNATTCEQLFDVINCKAPTPYLLNGLAVDLMPQDTNNDGTPDWGMVQLWAKDFDNGSSHPCGYKVYLSFSPDLNNTSKVFTCNDLGEQEVTIYASIITPQGNVISAWATSFVDIQDNMGVCPDNRIGISGRITTPQNESLVDAEVKLEGGELMIDMTGDNGDYSFPAMSGGNSYLVNPTKNDDYTNGISTLDLVLIQRHILSISKLNSPYKIIAADINKDAKITTSDLVQLRKLILGTTDKFENNSSWRFIDKAYTFGDALNPLNENFPENYVIPSLDSEMNIDFTAVKVGDVNGSALSNVKSTSSDPRSNEKLMITADNVQFNAGDIVSLNLTTEQAKELYGIQFTLNFDNNVLEFAGFEGQDIAVKEENIGLRYVDRGLITASYSNDKLVSVENLMNFTFIAKQKGSLSSSVNITSDFTKAEAYDNNEEVLNIGFRTKGDATDYELFQNNPNPFATSTNVTFKLPVGSDVKFTIYDATGKVIKVMNNNYEAGTHTISLDRSNLQTSGVLFYKMEAGDFTATKKMVIIE